MSPAALHKALQGEHEPLQHLVVPSRLQGRAVLVRKQRRGAYAIDRPGRVALRRIRQGLDLSQHDLARRAGVCVGTVQRLEAGTSRRLTIKSIAGFSYALGISSELFEQLLNLPVEVGDGSAAA